MVSSFLLGMLISALPNGFIRAGCRNLPKGSLSTNKKTKKSEKSREHNYELKI
jgi:hypothetical protein